MFGELPEAKRLKFIIVDDTEGKPRSRVKVNLESVEIAELPDSYRRANSVYPRSWFPTEMPPSPSKRARRIRFVEDDVDDGAHGPGEGLSAAEMGRGMHVGRVTVPDPMEEDGEPTLRVPGLARRANGREEKLNDLGYRMSWSQSRLFAGRMVFLQKSRESLSPSPSVWRGSRGAGGSMSGRWDTPTDGPAQWTRIATRSAARWPPAARRSRPRRPIWRRGWGKRCGWRGSGGGREDRSGRTRREAGGRAGGVGRGADRGRVSVAVVLG